MTKTSPAKTHQCYRCGRAFARAEHLQRHERSHTKEKPFRCPLCPQAFTRKDLLTRHDRLVHQPLNQHRTATSTNLADSPISLPGNGLDAFTLAPFSNTRQLTSGNPLTEAEPLMLQPNNATFPPKVNFQENVYSEANAEPLPPDTSYGASANDIEISGLYNTDYFALFLDSISLPNHPYHPAYQPLPAFSPDEQFSTADLQIRQLDANGSNEQEAPEAGFSRFGSRLPSLGPDATEEGADQETTSVSHRELNVFGKISQDSRERILRQLKEYNNVIPEGTLLPSRHALHRFISGYASVFHEHFPLLHLPTLSMETVSLELFLSIAALGAQYCREKAKALELYYLAKTVALESLRRYDENHRVGFRIPGAGGDSVTTPSTVSDRTGFSGVCTAYADSAGSLLQTVQALLLVIALAMWSEHRPPAQEALSLQSLVASLLQRNVLSVPEDYSAQSWEEWVHIESIRRTKLLVASFLSLLTIVFDVPPALLFSEMTIELPCSEKEWRADTREKWRELQNEGGPRPRFHQALQELLSDPTTSERATKIPSFSSLGGYGLIHAIIQDIWLLHQAARLPPRRERTLSPKEITAFEHALKRWRHAWEEDRESSIDPLSPHGRLSFNSAALLRLAYIRINIDSGSIRALSTWNPSMIAQSLLQSPSIRRSDKMTRAALHCAHGLSVPIKLGISFVAHTQIYFWSNQHALCSLECALLLTKWLEVVTVRNPQPPLKHEESKLLEFVVQMVAETEFDAPRDYLLENNMRLSAIVVKIWAKLFRSDSIWEMVDLIGRSLGAYAGLLEGASRIQSSH